MPKEEVKNKGFDLLETIVEKILDSTELFHIHPLKTEKFDEQQGQGLIILSLKQIIIRLPILLAQ